MLIRGVGILCACQLLIVGCLSKEGDPVERVEPTERGGKAHYTYQHGVRNGRYVENDSMGVVIEEGMYLNDFRNGMFRRFGKSGELLSEREYSNDTLVLDRRFSLRSGNILTEERMVKGDSAVFTSWWPTTVKERGSSVQGIKVGGWVSWYPNGNIRSKGRYMYPPVDTVVYETSSSVTIGSVLESRMERNVKDGAWEYYSEDGEPMDAW